MFSRIFPYKLKGHLSDILDHDPDPDPAPYSDPDPEIDMNTDPYGSRFKFANLAA
jgi:hypothetical protein